MSGSILIDPAEYLTESEVIKRWPMLTAREIRRARKANPPQIAFYAFPKAGGGPCCTPQQVQEYINRTYLRDTECREVGVDTDSKSATITSTSLTSTAEASGTPAGMTKELAQHAAEALAQRILNRPKSRLPHSSQRRRKPGKARLHLIKS